MNSIPSFDLTRQYGLIGDRLRTVLEDVLSSGCYIGGAAVAEFESQFAQYIGTHTCISCNSGTDALFLALRALGIGPGDEVITPPFTFISSSEVISAVGATPVFVDIEPGTFNLDLDHIPGAITSRTRAILPVHLFGQPVDMTRLMAIATTHHLAVIEDCAQATGAEWEGRKVGSFGTVGCFSFYPTKNLGACGDGGAITTHDPALAESLRMLKNHGSGQRRYHHEAVGVNSRLDAVQAALLLVKLPYLDHWNHQRQAIAQRYTEGLQGIDGLQSPSTANKGTSVWNQYTIRVSQAMPKGSALHEPQLREQIRQTLQHQGIGSNIYYPLPLHLQPVYQSLGYKQGQFPEAERAAQDVLSLPMFPELTQAEQAHIVQTLADCLSQNLRSLALQS